MLKITVMMTCHSDEFNLGTNLGDRVLFLGAKIQVANLGTNLGTWVVAFYNYLTMRTIYHFNLDTNLGGHAK